MKKCVLLSVLLLFNTSCHEEIKRDVIYTSFYPIYDLTKRIVRDRLEVINLTESFPEPHEFEPTAKEVVKVTEARCLLLNGVNLESYYYSLPKVIKDKTYLLSDRIQIKKVDNIDDPHYYLSIYNAINMMDYICDILNVVDNDNISFYRKNFEEEKKKFISLDNEYRERIKEKNIKNIVVAHAAFGYLCSDYDINQFYINDLSYSDEPTIKKIASTISFIKENNIKTIFIEENSFSYVNQIAKETNCRIETLSTLEFLSKEEIEENNDYISVMKDNLLKILEVNDDQI